MSNGSERFETVIVGGGQAGLATGYHLRRRGAPFVILDEQHRVGDAWRTRWDSLRLFTPAQVDGLPGLRFPAPAWSFPTKDEMADYLEAYAARFELPVRAGVRVDRMSRNGDGYVLSSSRGTFEAGRVVVATGANRHPSVPEFASELDPRIVRMHSAEYRNPSQLREGRVLVVGVGNSGAEISLELSGSHPTWLAGKESGQIPVRHGSSIRARSFFRVVRFVGGHVLTRRTPIGRKVLPKLESKASPLVRVRAKDLAAAGIQRVPRVVGVQDGLPRLADGRVLEVENVIWCTGFRRDFPWIDLPIFRGDGRPEHERGVVTSEPGVYFVGMLGQFALSSEVIPGVGRDAAYIVKRMTSGRRNGRRPARIAGGDGREVSERAGAGAAES